MTTLSFEKPWALVRCDGCGRTIWIAIGEGFQAPCKQLADACWVAKLVTPCNQHYCPQCVRNGEECGPETGGQ